jgi:hypothetical protein
MVTNAIISEDLLKYFSGVAAAEAWGQFGHQNKAKLRRWKPFSDDW